MDYITLILAFICGLGVMYGVTSLRRPKYDGEMIVNVNEEGKLIYILELNGDPADLQDQHSVIFRVAKESS